MAGAFLQIPLSPVGSVIADPSAAWQKPIYPSQAYRGGSFVLSVIGLFSAAPGALFGTSPITSNDALNWSSSDASWAPINATGTYTIWPNDLCEYCRIVYLPSSKGSPGTLAGITYSLFANLKIN